jgi:hypothetical protein
MSNSSGEYEDHVARQNTAYLIAFEEFEAGLTPEERALLHRGDEGRHHLCLLTHHGARGQ